MSPRCERCDREECRVEETAAALEAAMEGDTALSAYGAAWCARRVCDAHAVDWRARALAAEAERDALRDRSEEWESYRYERWAQADEMWRLAWAAGWAAVGQTVLASYWCRTALAVVSPTDEPGLLAEVGRYCAAIDAAHGKETP